MSPKPLRSAGPASQSGELDPLRVAMVRAEAFAGTRDPVELVIARRLASAPFSSGSAGGPPTVCALSPSGNRHRSPTRGPIQSSGVGACVARGGSRSSLIGNILSLHSPFIAPVRPSAPRVGPVVRVSVFPFPGSSGLVVVTTPGIASHRTAAACARSPRPPGRSSLPGWRGPSPSSVSSPAAASTPSRPGSSAA